MQLYFEGYCPKHIKSDAQAKLELERERLLATKIGGLTFENYLEEISVDHD